MTISAPCRTAARLVAVVAMFTGVVALAPTGADAAGTLVVTKTADTSDGACNADCSLREAIVASNAAAGAETITFTGAGIGTITLGSALPDITSDITIEGTGAGSVKIDGAGLHRAFLVQAAANLTLRKLTVQNTRAEPSLAGGAILSDGPVSIDGVSFVGNHAPANGGGAIWINNGVTTIANSTFSGNSTGGDGGAIDVPSGGRLHAYNSTFTGNTAAISGGAISSSSSSSTVVNSTIVGNTGAGAVYGYGTVTNSILAGNAQDCAYVTVTNSLVGDGTCITPGANGNRSGDAGLGALTGNPASYPLTATSQAVNAGSNALAVSPGGAALTLDQNGTARVQQGTVDLGAVESPFTGIPQVTIGPASADVAEGAGTSLTISRSGASAVAPLAVKLGITRGAGASNTDYALTGGAITAQTGAATVTIPAGSTSVTVDLAAAADALDEVDELVTLALTADAAYTLGAPASSQVKIVDIDDSPTLSIGDVSVTEGDTGTVGATFTVTQSAASTLSVAVDYATSNGTAVVADDFTATSGTLTFAPGDTSKTVTVSVKGDQLDEVDETFGIALSAPTDATIADGTGTGTILDDDTGGVTVTPLDGLVTTEAGGTGTFTVVLDSQPTSDVTVAVASSDTGEGTPAAATLTFTAANWATPQTVTLTGVDDSVDDGDIAYEVGLTVTSADDGYDGFEAGPVAVTNTDDDGAGVTVSPPAGLVTTEAGGTATFTVVLDSQPTGDVTVAVASSDAGEGTAAAADLTFTAANWATAQTVTVTGVDDAVDDGDVGYEVGLTVASADALYDGYETGPVVVTNTDDDTAGVTVTALSDLETTEAGDTATFTVVLDSQPTGDVTVAVASSDTSEGTAAASSTFTPTNWATPQTVTVTGVDDDVDDGDVGYEIGLTVASADQGYDGLESGSVEVTNTDDDTAGVTVTPVDGLATTEAGGTATFTVVLDSQPTGDVTVAVASSDTGEGTAAPATLTFAPANWATPQTATVTGVDDAVADGDIAYEVGLTVTSGDALYDGSEAGPVSVTNTDDDTAGITVTPLDGLAATEAGGTATFTVVLDSEPTDEVTVAVASGATGARAAATATLTFTAADWATPQSVTITGVDDAVDDGDITYEVDLTVTSADALYDGFEAGPVSVTNIDDDTAGVTVTPLDGLVTTEAGGTSTFTAVLDSEPTDEVMVEVASTDTDEGTVAAAMLTFTAANWATPQTVTVTGVDDAIDDGDVAYAIDLSVTSSDALYDGFDAGPIAATNIDDDVEAAEPPVTTPPAPTPLATPPTTPPTSAASVLPRTGTDLALSLSLGTTTLAFGLALVRLSRRRRAV